MKRRIVASLSVLLALGGRAWSQSPTPAENPGVPGRARVIVPDGPALSPAESNPIVIDEGPPAVKPSETIAAPKAKPAVAPAPSPVAAACAPPNGAPQKPLLIDTHCGPPDSFWARGGYLYWRVEDMPLPQVLAVDGAGNTILGGRSIDFGNFSGGKVEAGTWRGPRHAFGFEFGAFVLQERSSSAGVASAGGTITRPVFDVVTNTIRQFPVALAPGASVLPPQSGGLSQDASSQFGGFDLNAARNLAYCESWSFDVLAGVRYLNLQEDLTLRQFSQQMLPALPAGQVVVPGQQIPGFIVDRIPGFTALDITDRFQTRNQFWGGQVGGRFEARRGIWFGSLTGKVALGSNHQVTELSGETVGTGGGLPRTAVAAGLLAVPGGEQAVNPVTGQVLLQANGQPVVNPLANAGTRKTDWFTVVPEVGVQLGAQVTRSVRAHIGYSFIYMNNVVRPGDTFDPVVNSRFVPSTEDYRTLSGVARPSPRSQRDDFIAHGLELGLGLQF